MTDSNLTQSLPVLPTITCSYCGRTVPDARYCGACGADLLVMGHRAQRRLRAYAAFPDEPVNYLSVVSTLAPQLPRRARPSFRVAFAVVVALLVLFSLTGAAAPLIGVCALGLPLLFILYLFEVDPYEGTFLVPSAVCLLIGAGLGAGWALIGGSYVDRALQPVPGASPVSTASIVAAVLVGGSGQLLMCVPMVVVRFTQKGSTESLDGFAAGATGALGFTMSATVALMAPWLTNGQLTHESFLENLAEAVLRGVSLPLIGGMTTGLIGAAWWTNRADRRIYSWVDRWATSGGVVLAFGLAIQIGLGFTDLARLSNATLVVVHLIAVGLLIVVSRQVLHHILLDEAAGIVVGPPRVCSHCEHLVPTMAFCPNCGIAERAIPRSRRSISRRAPDWVVRNVGAGPPSQVGAPWPTAPQHSPGATFGFPDAPAPPSHNHVPRVAMAATIAGGLVTLAIVLTVVAVFAPPGPPPPCPPLRCQGPPTKPVLRSPLSSVTSSAPVQAGRVYRARTGFSLRVLPVGTSYPLVDVSDHSISLTYPFTAEFGGTSTLTVTGSRARGATSQTLIQRAIGQLAPDASADYQIPGAYIGYQPGSGWVYEAHAASSDGSTQTYQLSVLASVVNGFGITVVTEGTLLKDVASKSPLWDGNPSPAAVNVDYVANDTVNSITFPGLGSP